MTHRLSHVDRRTALKLIAVRRQGLPRVNQSSTQAASPTQTKPFVILVREKDLNDLKLRLSLSRWPEDSANFEK